MTTHEEAIFKAGYCRSPNNDQEWYPRGPFVPVLTIDLHRVYLRPDGHIEIGQYIKGRENIVRQYDSVALYLATCDGKSEGGQPAGFMNVWD
jgi:hypothetical protein